MGTKVKSAMAERFGARLGGQHGSAAASWVTFGTESEARAMLRGLEDGDPELLDWLPQHGLSGEWADGYSGHDLLRDLEAELGHEATDWEFEEAADAYELAFSSAVETAVSRSAQRMLA